MKTTRTESTFALTNTIVDDVRKLMDNNSRKNNTKRQQATVDFAPANCFVLTGSDSFIDELEARGQNSLF